MIFKTLFFSFSLTFFCSQETSGHGFMYMPPNRASLWRFNRQAAINYNDNAYYCGGFYTQYYINDGKCGPCGDDWRDPVPRSNENGGFYGRGIVVVNYTAGQVIDVHSLITANHLGNLYFSLCKLEDPNVAETEDCFQSLNMSDGSPNHPIKSLDYNVTSYIKLPDNFTCDRCVLRWHYRAGNNWGVCEDGTQLIGCGNQETFRGCADISINQMETDRGETLVVNIIPENYSQVTSGETLPTSIKPESQPIFLNQRIFLQTLFNGTVDF